MTAARESGKQAMASAGSTEEEIIELTDAIPAAAEEDGLIELEDEIDAAAAADEDSIIELEDEVGVGRADAPQSGAGGRPVGPPDRLDDADAAPPAEFPDSDIKIADILEDDLDDEVHQDDFVNSLGMDLETNAAIDHIPDDAAVESELPPSTEHLSEPVSSEQIEAAVERVLLRMLPERIDGILREAVERTLTREIERIKGLLLED